MQKTLVVVDIIRNAPGMVRTKYADPEDRNSMGDYRLYEVVSLDGEDGPLERAGWMRGPLWTGRRMKSVVLEIGD